NGLDDDISIRFTALKGLIKYDYKLPGPQKPSEEIEKRSRIDALTDKIKNFRELVKSIIKIKILLRKKLTLKDYSLDIEFGAGDAFYTGILSGMIWAAVGAFTSYIVNTFKTCKKHVDVKTDFNQFKFRVELHCIFNIRIVNIIVVVIKLYLHNLKKKRKKRNAKKQKEKAVI
ncbi:MAG TPA: DUF2953 domain-containing protein, partial [Clostridia bacterium]|nr:DUF2953 domain-containing protein [Clostridia bacterium]